MNKLKWLFKLTAKEVVKQLGVEVTPTVLLVMEFVFHYFFGKQQTKTLPVWAVEETKRAVINSLLSLQRDPSWKIHTAQVGKPIWDGWFTTLAGVVGTFNYEMEVIEGGLKIACKDFWDFNAKGYSSVLKLPLKQSRTRDLVLQVISFLHLPVIQEDDCLKIKENELVCLNKEHAFWTYWEFIITWEDIGCENPNIYNWKIGGLPKTWIHEQTKQIKEIESPPEFLHTVLNSETICDDEGNIWVWSPTWERWELENLYADYE